MKKQEVKGQPSQLEQVFGRAKTDFFSRAELDSMACPRVAAFLGPGNVHVKTAEPGYGYLVSSTQRSSHFRKDSFNRVPGFLFGAQDI